MRVRLISKTAPVWGVGEREVVSPDDTPQMTAEQMMIYIARVSSPQNQTNHLTAARLLKYCIDHGHWSVFDMADMTVEVETSRAISAQVVRHWSMDGVEVVGDFRYQEFSQRYAQVVGFETYEARRQADKNRQGSVDDLPDEDKEWFLCAQSAVQSSAGALYDEAVRRGIAKECARFLLPMSAKTRFYMKGTVRSWVHYLRPRCAPDAQAEHREIALDIRQVFAQEFPATCEAALDFKLPES